MGDLICPVFQKLAPANDPAITCLVFPLSPLIRRHSPGPYYVAKLTATLPLNLAIALAFAWTGYGMFGFRHSAVAFVQVCAVVCHIAWASVGLSSTMHCRSRLDADVVAVLLMPCLPALFAPSLLRPHCSPIPSLLPLLHTLPPPSPELCGDQPVQPGGAAMDVPGHCHFTQPGHRVCAGGGCAQCVAVYTPLLLSHCPHAATHTHLYLHLWQILLRTPSRPFCSVPLQYRWASPLSHMAQPCTLLPCPAGGLCHCESADQRLLPGAHGPPRGPLDYAPQVHQRPGLCLAGGCGLQIPADLPSWRCVCPPPLTGHCHVS